MSVCMSTYFPDSLPASYYATENIKRNLGIRLHSSTTSYELTLEYAIMKCLNMIGQITCMQQASYLEPTTCKFMACIQSEPIVNFL